MKAKQEYLEALRFSNEDREHMFIMDIIRQEVKNDDPRIQRRIRK